MQSVDYVISAKHYAQREGASSVYERIQRLAGLISQHGQVVIVAGPEPRGFAVMAAIEFGQWVGHCECGGAEMVDPDEPIYFCFGCANRSNGGYLRPVIFPEDRQEIERLVLERPVDDMRGLDDLDRAFQAKPMLYAQVVQPDGEIATLPLSRSWAPGETVSDLIQQNEAVYAWRESLVEKKGGK